MTPRQRVVLKKAFYMIADGAREGAQKSAADWTIDDAVKRVDELQEMLGVMKETIKQAQGAGAVLDRAKTLSSSGAKR